MHSRFRADILLSWKHFLWTKRLVGAELNIFEHGFHYRGLVSGRTYVVATGILALELKNVLCKRHLTRDDWSVWQERATYSFVVTRSHLSQVATQGYRFTLPHAHHGILYLRVPQDTKV